jgi:hypothetical protein
VGVPLGDLAGFVTGVVVGELISGPLFHLAGVVVKLREANDHLNLN